MMKRLHDERGFALVTAMILLSVMTGLMVIALTAGNASFTRSERGARWSKTLAVAETGVDNAITMVAENRNVSNPCLIGSADVCSTPSGQYQLEWGTNSKGGVTITSNGYYPTLANAQIARQVEVTYEPEPIFRYALFSNAALDLKNNADVIGDIYAGGPVTLEQNMVVCGSIIASGGNVTIGNNTDVLQSWPDGVAPCSGKSGQVWANGSIEAIPGSGVDIEGDAKASAPSGTVCNAAITSYQIVGGTVNGQATACGRITSSTTGPLPGTASDPPAVVPLPTYTFDPNNYPGLTCYPSSGVCGATNTSTTAVAEFNPVAGPGMQGTYAIWQTSPSQVASSVVDLEGLTLSGDLTIVTNAPIDLGNTGEVTTTAGSANLVIISLYQGTGVCNDTGGDCAIYGKNSVVFDPGAPNDPDDGVAGLLYTPGKMAFKNNANSAEGAIYAGSMDMKNGFDIVYNSRIERTLGFGSALVQTLWQELQPPAV